MVFQARVNFSSESNLQFGRYIEKTLDHRSTILLIPVMRTDHAQTFFRPYRDFGHGWYPTQP
ncbi:hypothetical protein VN12_03425 [Pirellula sp. SH-Sr6A]|uniref:hypothetical protein n=1 Tax=Pirellula sp. SH-Sr6A TaxID=1632865 RepID=UPI00078EA5FA|nr:hypothetical protein [Pirellula sp. SH-Sr6A]AMV31142.1 hypothetical protein VN12_03425 [Pirellula sp. SH-Sr6A]